MLDMLLLPTYVDCSIGSIEWLCFECASILLLFVLDFLMENKLLHFLFVLWFAGCLEPSFAWSRLLEGILFDVGRLHQGTFHSRILVSFAYMIPSASPHKLPCFWKCRAWRDNLIILSVETNCKSQLECVSCYIQ